MKIEDNSLEIFIVNKIPKGTNALMNFYTCFKGSVQFSSVQSLSRVQLFATP